MRSKICKSYMGLGILESPFDNKRDKMGPTETTRLFCPLCSTKLKGLFFFSSTKVVVCMFSLCCSLSVNSIILLRESFLALVKIKFESSSCFLGMGNLGKNEEWGKWVSFFFVMWEK